MYNEINMSEELKKAVGENNEQWDELNSPVDDSQELEGDIDDVEEKEEDEKSSEESIGEVVLEAALDNGPQSELTEKGETEKRRKFGDYMLTDEELRISDISLSEVRHRSPLDVLGRKMDEIKLEKLKHCPFRDIDRYLTPTVADQIVSKLQVGYIGDWPIEKLIEVVNHLPLSAQESIAESVGGHGLLMYIVEAKGVVQRSAGGKSLVNKLMAGYTKKIREGLSPRELSWLFRSGSATSDQIRAINTLIENVSSENRHVTMEAAEAGGAVSHFNAVIALGDRDELLKALKELGRDGEEPNIAQLDMIFACRVPDKGLSVDEDGEPVEAEEREKRLRHQISCDELDKLCGGMARYDLIKTIRDAAGGQYRLLGTQFAGFNEEEAKEYNEFLSKIEPVIDSLSEGSEAARNLFITGVLFSAKGKVLVEEAVGKMPLDEVIEGNLKKYLKRFGRIDAKYKYFINSLCVI